MKPPLGRVLMVHVFIFIVLLIASAAAQANPRVRRFIDAETVSIIFDNTTATLHIGEHLNDWTLMQVIQSHEKVNQRYAVLENFQQQNGELIFIDSSGVRLRLPKASEPTEGDPS